MPRNQGIGGNKRRKGKKNATFSINKSDLVKKDEDQMYARVIALLGSGRLNALCDDGEIRMCKIRGKMMKKDFIKTDGIILVSRREYEDKKADVIHTHSYGYFQNHAAWIKEKFQSTPWVITPHFHPSWSMWGGAKRRTLRDFYDSKIGKSTMESADLITCVSEHEKEMLIKEIGLNDDNIKIIYNGIYWKDWAKLPDKTKFRKKFPEVSDKFIIFAGRLATNKGIPDLIEAVSIEGSQRFDLVVMGADMGLGNELDKLAVSKNIKMHRIGHVDDEIYRSALSAAEVLVLPSEYEAFGIVLLEAAAAQTPVVAARVGGVPEAMSEENNGLLVDYNDPENLSKAIFTILEDDNLSKEMATFGRSFAKGFSWSNIVNMLEKEYNLLLA